MNDRLRKLVDNYVEKSGELAGPIDEYLDLSKKASGIIHQINNLFQDFAKLGDKCKTCSTDISNTLDDLSKIFKEIENSETEEISDDEFNEVLDLWNSDATSAMNAIDDLDYHAEQSKKFCDKVEDSFLGDFYLNKD